MDFVVLSPLSTVMSERKLHSFKQIEHEFLDIHRFLGARA